MEKHGKGECDQHFSVVERYKTHYEKYLKRINNVPDFIAAQQAVLTSRNALRQLTREPEVYWLFAQYYEADVPLGPRKAARISRLQSTYCLARERFQSYNEVWNLIFSDMWGNRRESQAIRVAIVNYAQGTRLRLNPGTKSPQDSNIVRLRQKREYQERVLAGPSRSGQLSAESSDILTEDEDESSSGEGF